MKSTKLIIALLREYGPPGGFLALLVGLWELIVNLTKVPDYLVPSPSHILLTFVSYDKTLYVEHIGVTIQEILVGFVLGSSIGIAAGILIAYSRFLEKTVYPLAILVKVTPIIAVAPLLTIWFGYGITSKIIVVVIISFFFPLVNTALGFRSVDPDLIHLLQSLSASELQTFFKVKLPMALPFIFSALKMSITTSVIGAVVGEFVGSVSGLGYLTLVAQSSLNVPLVFMVLTTLAIIGMALFAVVSIAERFLIPWARHQPVPT